LFMGLLSVRFRHKSLLMMGLLFMSISALGCGFAPNFDMMLLLYSISGLGIAMVTPMLTTTVGENFPLEKRASAIGWIYAFAALSYVIGAPVISFIAGFGGWRLAFLSFVLFTPLLGLLLAAKGLPSTSRDRRPAMSLGSYLEGFKAVLSNRSADACLVGTALGAASFQAILIYSSSFFRQRFLVSIGFASTVTIGGALGYTLGSVGGGRFVKRFGRKLFTVLTAFIVGMFATSYTSLPNLWLSVAFSVLGCLFAGMRGTATTSLTLEQVPSFRGTMMSINSAATSMGSALGAGLGGLALLMFNYEGVGISLGGMGIAAAIIFHLLATDPTGTEMRKSGTRAPIMNG